MPTILPTIFEFYTFFLITSWFLIFCANVSSFISYNDKLNKISKINLIFGMLFDILSIICLILMRINYSKCESLYLNVFYKVSFFTAKGSESILVMFSFVVLFVLIILAMIIISIVPINSKDDKSDTEVYELSSIRTIFYPLLVFFLFVFSLTPLAFSFNYKTQTELTIDHSMNKIQKISPYATVINASSKVAPLGEKSKKGDIDLKLKSGQIIHLSKTNNDDNNEKINGYKINPDIKDSNYHFKKRESDFSYYKVINQISNLENVVINKETYDNLKKGEKLKLNVLKYKPINPSKGTKAIANHQNKEEINNYTIEFSKEK